jgi:hypothetical protein
MRQPGKGKIGRMNANEPLMRLRDVAVIGNGYYDDEWDTGPCGLTNHRKGYPIPAVKKASSPIVSHTCGTE